jgi:hypothetical protein
MRWFKFYWLNSTLILILSVPLICHATETFLICEGVTESTLIDRDEETRRTILRDQPLRPTQNVKSYILSNGAIKVSNSKSELKNCAITQYLILCERPLSKLEDNWRSYWNLEINRVDGKIEERFGSHAYGGKVNGVNAIQIHSSTFTGTCRRTSQLLF